ncbi:hypothetical protein GCM10022243_15130 [Saccharothrix violaceirubra]|uniref:Uncharacterized protein n=1 Tax=Saccharothrix violaceirubra TaxID=413306 RepID=A0A7W7T6C0_9PSEU|nr:hypothetical protein [Saccharothrix violaceirubra]MBB4967388.1 hypothetical protein [Saccharothrix violaceirubra]
MGDADKACETPVCAHRTGAGFHLCGQCRQVLARELLSLPALHRECGAWHDDARTTRVRADVDDILASWCSLVVCERGVVGPATGEVEDLAVFLDVNLAWLAGHAAAADFAVEVRELVEAAGRPVTDCGHATCAPDRCEAGQEWLALRTRAPRRPSGGHRARRRRTKRRS